MLVTKQNVFRRFWYATVPMDQLKDGPRPFTLLGEKLALFLDGDGRPGCLEDRCLHRTAKLSKGWIRNGRLVCWYHGWEYDRDGKLVGIPQFPPEQTLPACAVKNYRAQERYGYVWVALEEPLQPVPEFDQDGAPGWRRIHQFYDTWKTSSLRLMENSFDNSHIAFVHKNSFGDITQPKPEKYEVTETEWGFEAETIVTVVNPPNSERITGTTDKYTRRHMRNRWFMPFTRRLDIEYPSGLRHVIMNCATPIDDGSIQVVQVLFRNDDEASCPAQELIDWDGAIIREDQDVLESTSPDAIVDVSRKIEMHMPSDRPGMIIRRRLLELMKAHGEVEVPAA
jgi:phenylpropionate dioxygenase-like ring-hydroxylating dioxygenase large terminal subunit